MYHDSRSDCYQINHEIEDVKIKENITLLKESLKRKLKKYMIGSGLSQLFTNIKR